MNIVRIVFRDIQEKNDANKLMKGNIDIKIFEKSPLVGCYMICCAPTSVLMSLITEQFGKVGWMEQAENI